MLIKIGQGEELSSKKKKWHKSTSQGEGQQNLGGVSHRCQGKSYFIFRGSINNFTVNKLQKYSFHGYDQRYK